MSEPSIADAAVTAGGLFVKALAGQDWTRLAECFDEGIRLRALTPHGLRAADDRGKAAACIRQWFESVDQLVLLASEVQPLADKLHIAYRFRAHEDQWYVIEQHAYCTVSGGYIQTIDLLCCGFRPEWMPGGRMPAMKPRRKEASMLTDPDTPLPPADAVLEMLNIDETAGGACALLTPAIKSRLRELQNEQVLEVRVNDPSAREDVAAWSRLSGHPLLAITEKNGLLRFFIRKKNSQAQAGAPPRSAGTA